MRQVNDPRARTRSDDMTGQPRSEVQDRSAPVSAARSPSSFWDHLGATRAAEYANDDILEGLIPPERVRDYEDPSFAPPWPQARRMDSPHPESFQSGTGAHWPQDVSQARVGHSNPAKPFVQGAASSPVSPPRQAQGGADEGWPLSHDPRPFAGFPQSRPVTGPRPNAEGGWDQEAAPRPALPRIARATGARLRRTDPAPSRLAYRLNRFWLTPLYRRILTVGLPVCLLMAAVVAVLSDPARQDFINQQIESGYSAIIDRPEFMVTDIRLPEVSAELQQAISGRIELDLPMSSFRLDLETVRAAIEGLDAIRSVDLRLLGDGVLAVHVVERVPVALWRSSEGLELIDVEGHRVGFALSRAARPDLPLIAGEGAAESVAEALALFDAAGPLSQRIVGLVRVGARRWDLVLDRDQRIMLPETRAQVALERVIALDQAQDLLARDLHVADFRLPQRPVLRLGAGALETIFEIRQ